MSYPCTSCGLCCKNVGKHIEKARDLVRFHRELVTEPIAEAALFPYRWDKDGRCENLLPDNKCAVYDHRPVCCNIEKMWEKYHQHLTKEEYFHLGAMICNSLILENKLDPKFLIPST